MASVEWLSKQDCAPSESTRSIWMGKETHHALEKLAGQRAAGHSGRLPQKGTGRVTCPGHSTFVIGT